jgi:MFS transporter, DHA2 family, multidrug resistance protein
MAAVVYANSLMLGYSPAMDWRLVVAATISSGPFAG